MNGIDVSVVLNMHREALFIEPTLRSLNECARVAMASGIRVELIAVFDRPDDLTREVFSASDLSAFEQRKVIEVDVGSLGLARNAGISEASGEYVWTSDADDLVSSNSIIVLLETARGCKDGKIVVFLEYLVAFGEQYHNVRYVGSEWFTAADFAFQHPFVSRIFAPRLALLQHPYRDLKVTSGFAYEDWDLNARLYAEGFEFRVAPQTILFYRQRAGSLLSQANAASVRMIPHGPLFERKVFTEAMGCAKAKHADWQSFSAKRLEMHEASATASFFESHQLVEHLREAIRLEPEIDPMRVETAGSYSPIPWKADHWGVQLDTLFGLVGSWPFTDVVLLPWLRPGGAEKYILQILAQLKRSDPDCRILVVTGQASKAHEWVSRLPPDSVFLDLFNSFPSLDESDRSALLVRALLAVSTTRARLHLKASPFSDAFFHTYATALRSCFDAIYYRFCDETYVWRDRSFRGGWSLAVLRRILPLLSHVVTDCRSIVEEDRARLGVVDRTYKVIYALCNAPDAVVTETVPKRRLLWASRITSQKRPDLLAKIAAEMERRIPGIAIDVYGTADPGQDPSAVFREAGRAINYVGPFSDFSEIPVETFDAFVYTSAFDGLPNIILEAMAAGLPVVAPDVGGIGEAVVNGKTGWLMARDLDDDQLVTAYVDALDAIYADWPKTMRLAKAARQLVLERHGSDTFSRRVAEVYSISADVRGVINRRTD